MEKLLYISYPSLFCLENFFFPLKLMYIIPMCVFYTSIAFIYPYTKYVL